MTPRSIAPVVLAVVLSLGAARSARADASSDLDAGEAAYAALDYDKANSLAQRAVATHGLGHEQVVRAYRLLGRTYAVLGKTDAATDAFQRLLTYAPDEKTDRSQPPRIQDAFAAAEGFWAGYPTRPGIEATTVALRAGAPATLRIHLRDPTHQVKKVVVGYRWGGTGPFTTAELAPAENLAVDVPAGPAQVARFDYYTLALDGLDDQAFVAGDAVTPKTALADTAPLPASASAERGGGGHSIFASPVFWIVAGVVVAGGATGAYFATRGTSSSGSPGQSGPPTGVALTPSLVCGNQRCN